MAGQREGNVSMERTIWVSSFHQFMPELPTRHVNFVRTGNVATEIERRIFIELHGMSQVEAIQWHICSIDAHAELAIIKARARRALYLRRLSLLPFSCSVSMSMPPLAMEDSG